MKIVITEAVELRGKQALVITENDGMEERLTENLLKKFSKPRMGIHVSDLTLCVRKAVDQQLNPRPPDIRSVGYFVDGARRDLIIKDLFGGQDVRGKEIDGIWFTPDVIDEVGDPTEIKTSRSESGIPEHYKLQLAFYIILLGHDKGHFLIQRIVPRKGQNPFEFWDVSFESEAEREALKLLMYERRDGMSKALEAKDIWLAPAVKNDRAANWICWSCPIKKECWGRPD